MIYGRLQDLILPFKIPMDTRKNFFKICRQFGYVPYRRFASLVGRLAGGMQQCTYFNLVNSELDTKCQSQCTEFLCRVV
jgi:hypothetical protein